MKKAIRYLLIGLAVLVVLAAWPAWQLYSELQKAANEDPLVWESDIAALERDAPGRAGAVLFTGSSSIRLWDTLAQDMQPLTTVKRGFGGAKIGDVLHYAERLTDIESPSAIVIFVGTNDVHPGASKEPELILDRYRQLIGRIRAQHAQVPIYYIAITPSIMRWSVWPIAQRVNTLIEQYSDSEEGLYFIDTGPALLDEGLPDPSLYVFDGLRLNAQGYARWNDIIRSRLLADLKPQSH